MIELAKLIVFECAYRYWRVPCGDPNREVYMRKFLCKPMRN